VVAEQKISAGGELSAINQSMKRNLKCLSLFKEKAAQLSWQLFRGFLLKLFSERN
jgi:hypothetical protein